MFIGHFAVAFAAKKAAPKVSLGTLVLAAAFLDVVWPVLVLLGVERFRIVPGFTANNPFDFTYYPWSHSLLMTVGWSLLVAFVYLAASRDRAGAVWVGIVVASHWVLDFVSHVPDMRLYPGDSGKLGLGLWRSIPATFAVEGLMFAAGIAIYVRATKSKDRIGSIAWWAMVVVLLALYIPGTLVFAAAESERRSDPRNHRARDLRSLGLLDRSPPRARGLMALLRYLAGLNAARTILWCYLIWYLTAVALYFDPSPSLWLTSIGISAIMGYALWLSAVNSPAGRIKIGRWQLFRLYMAPFAVSSFAALVKGKGFILVVFPTLKENAIALGGCALFATAAQLARRVSVPR